MKELENMKSEKDKIKVEKELFEARYNREMTMKNTRNE